MNSFAKVIDFVLHQEGGYVNDRNDPGGETKYGISKRSYPLEDIAALTRERAAFLYLRDYWGPIRGDDLPEQLALAVMDFAVNSGVPRASKMLQRLVGAKEDGEIGPLTLGCVKRTIESRSPQLLAEALILERALFLTRLGCTRWGSENFLPGWMRRIRDNLRFVRRAEGV